MLLFLFAGLLTAALLGFGLIWLLENCKSRNIEVLEEASGVKEWRERLDQCTNAFVALGAEPMLARACSNSNDPELARHSGKSLARYQRAKHLYLSLSYAYICASRAVQQAEAKFRVPGPLKLVTAAGALNLGEQLLEIKEIRTDFYRAVLAPERGAPAGQNYRLDYIFKLCAKLTEEIESNLKTIRSGPQALTARLEKAQTALAATEAKYQALSAAQVNYLPFETQTSAIADLRTAITSGGTTDAEGALERCAGLDQAIAALTKELGQAGTLLDQVGQNEGHFKTAVAYVAKVRGTAVTCPWSDAPAEAANWRLASAGSNPDDQLAQCETLLRQARQSLAQGHLQTVPAECQQAHQARMQAENMVKAQLDAKVAIDDQVPRVRAEVAAVRAEKLGIAGSASTHEMALLVDRTCSAVEGRIQEVYRLYQLQHFPEALSVLKGTAGEEYGLPITKLLEQAKELLKLLQQAAKVANTLAVQTA